MAEISTTRFSKALLRSLNDPIEGRVFCCVERVAGAAGLDPQEEARKFASRICGVEIRREDVAGMSRPEAGLVARTMFHAPMRPATNIESSDTKVLASQFLGLFDSDAQFFSTFRYQIDRPDGDHAATGHPLFNAFFEMGFFAAGATQCGVLWVVDAD